MIKRFKMTDLGVAHDCLGMRIRQTDTEIAIDQEEYTRNVLSKFGMDKCAPVKTPMVPGTVLVRDNDDGKDPLLDKDAAAEYRGITGSLMYLQACTRPDLSVAVSMLAGCLATPRKTHMDAAKHVLRYLRGTATLGLHYKKTLAVCDANVLKGYSDATWADCPSSRRSMSGNVFLLNGAAVSWKTRRQPTVALSSAQAEYQALTESMKQVTHLRHLLKEIGLEQKPTVIAEDNTAAIHIAENPVTSGRSKHIEVQYHYVREVIESGNVCLEYVPTGEMVADALTKNLNAQLLKRHRQVMLGEEE